MKIDITEDLKFLEKKIKMYTLVYISLISISIIVNVLLIIFSNYFNKINMIILSILFNFVCSFFIYLFIENFALRFKRIFKLLKQIDNYNETKVNGKIIQVSNTLTYRKNIRVKEVTISSDDKISTFYFLCDFYESMGLENLGKYISVSTKERFIIGVVTND